MSQAGGPAAASSRRERSPSPADPQAGRPTPASAGPPPGAGPRAACLAGTPARPARAATRRSICGTPIKKPGPGAYWSMRRCVPTRTAEPAVRPLGDRFEAAQRVAVDQRLVGEQRVRPPHGRSGVHHTWHCVRAAGLCWHHQACSAPLTERSRWFISFWYTERRTKPGRSAEIRGYEGRRSPYRQVPRHAVPRHAVPWRAALRSGGEESVESRVPIAE